MWNLIFPIKSKPIKHKFTDSSSPAIMNCRSVYHDFQYPQKDKYIEIQLHN